MLLFLVTLVALALLHVYISYTECVTIFSFSWNFAWYRYTYIPSCMPSSPLESKLYNSGLVH